MRQRILTLRVETCDLKRKACPREKTKDQEIPISENYNTIKLH